MSAEFDDTTEPLVNGARLPEHPALTTAKRVTAYGGVFDDVSGIRLSGGLHQGEIACLMRGEQMALRHLFRYAIRNGKIYHTRDLVCINVKCIDIPNEPATLTPPTKN